ncbi:MAG: hypothetical protein A2Y31_04590 [Spirochaetes bacterium GWC2_52_13]|nr:MAG: hypothetical protein A2Y31_04590 [Spirochaetes bacterium GWC2_52_13]HCG63331.1 hypothetical protein [Sphaerochaeta sp.]
MKKWSLLVVALLVALTFTGCMSMFTALTVDPPVSTDASMLVLEAEDGTTGDYLFNTNATGWAPVVEDKNGAIVPFKMVNILADSDTFYFAENIMAGTYTLKGFRHVYTDYGLLPDGIIPNYEPYVSNPYHIRQEFMLDKPIVLQVKPAEMASFGKYSISSSWVGGAAGTTDDRWKVAPSSVKIVSNPADKNMLRAVKGITNANWAPWNARNPENPL